MSLVTYNMTPTPTKQGSFAKYIVVDAEDCAKKAPSLDPPVVPASTTECITALQAMCDLGGLAPPSPPMLILIIGAGVGVGSMAIVITKHQLKGHVTAVCSTRDVPRVQDELGADIVIDLSKGDIFELDQRFDVVFDTPCALSAIKCSNRVLAKGGSYISTLPTFSMLAAQMMSIFSGKNAQLISCWSKRSDLELIGRLLEDKIIAVVDNGMIIDLTFPIKDIQQAMRCQRSCGKIGCVAIQVEGGW